MILINWCNVVLCAAAVCGVQLSGWLDRVVLYHKEKFYDDLLDLASINIDARVERAPPGYQDSAAWSRPAVVRLLYLLGRSTRAGPARRALRSLLQPTRRLRMDKQKSYRIFPSLSKHIENYLYYDVDTDAEYSEALPSLGVVPDNAVVVVTNPVEARLPSAHISVKLIKDILEARAEAARVMPSTTRSTFPWKVMNRTQSANAIATTLGSDGGAGGAGGTTGTSGGAVTTVAAAANGTAPAG